MLAQVLAALDRIMKPQTQPTEISYTSHMHMGLRPFSLSLLNLEMGSNGLGHGLESKTLKIYNWGGQQLFLAYRKDVIYQ